MLLLKNKLKFIVTLFIIMLLSISLISTVKASDEIMPISVDNSIKTTQSTNSSDTVTSDLYISGEKEYSIANSVEGNAFISVDTLNLEPISNENNISGNLYAIADTVNIKSDISYSQTETDKFGNSKIDSVNKTSSISGNVIIIANKLVIEPGCTIDGDLYVLASEVDLGQNSVVSGNSIIVASNVKLNGKINGDLYVNSKDFDMQYYGYIRRDFHLNTNNANLNGYINRSSYITAKNITLNDNFMNEKDFNVTNSNNIIFSGKINGDATINSKNITVNDSCRIYGNLNYSSKQEINLNDGVVSGEVNYSKYNSNFGKDLLNYFLNLVAVLLFFALIYFVIVKVSPEYISRLSYFTAIDMLKSLGIGLGILILVPIVSILLFITNVGILVGLFLLALYAVLLIISIPVFIITIAEFIKNRFFGSINSFVIVLILTVLLSLLNLIPYFGLIVSILALTLGLGIFSKSLVKRY